MFQRIDTLNSPLAFFEGGNSAGKVLVLGHALGVDHHMWDWVGPLLADDFRLIVWDQPGHGESRLLAAGKNATMADSASALLAGIEDLGLRDYHLGGLSLGGMTSLAAAQMRPRGLASLGVFDAGPQLTPAQAWLDKAELVEREGTGGLVDSTLERWLTEEFRTGPGAEATERIRASFSATSGEGYGQCCRIIASANMWPRMEVVDVPALLMAGDQDASAPADLLAEMERALPGQAVTRIITSAMHLSAVESPDQFAAELRNFI